MNGKQEAGHEKDVRQVAWDFNARSGLPQVDPIEQATTVRRHEEALDLTLVNTNEHAIGIGISMFPSRRRQLVRDLAFIEDRKPWKILEDALEQYVITHYGTEFRRR